MIKCAIFDLDGTLVNSIDDKTINIGSVLLFLCALTVPIILALLKNTVKVKIKKTKTSTQKEVLVQDEIDKMLNS